jgi:hypothetical protein
VYAEEMADGDRPTEGAPEIPMFNAAGLQVYGAAWMLHIVFCDVQPGTTTDGAVKELPRMAIGIPWPLVKMLHRILAVAIAQYEAKEGTISVPRSVAAAIERQADESASH